MQLEVSAEDRRVLLSLLERSLGDTRAEVRRTRTADFKQALRSEEATLRTLIRNLHDLDETC